MNSGRMISFWEDWESYPVRCSCGWSGVLGDGIANYDSEFVTEIDCPACPMRLENLSNSATEKEIHLIADRGGKRAQQHFVELRNRKPVKTELHNLKLTERDPLPLGMTPVIHGYETVSEAEMLNHPALPGLSTWLEDYSIADKVYAAYKMPVDSAVAEEELRNIAFIYQDVQTGRWIEKPGTIGTYSSGRSVSWYSENQHQTARSRPEVPAAFLIKKSEATPQELLNIYSFTIQDKDPECLTFGCTATSLEQAQAKARAAGYRELTLIDVREPTGVELSNVANLELISNPLLGEEWLPLVSALDSALSKMRVGSSWSMDFMAKAYNYDTSDAPYTQAIMEGDGSLHLEIGPTSLVESRSDNQQQLLKFLGWNAPMEQLPNYFRVFEPGWNPRHVAYVFLQTISLNFDITTSDLFTFTGSGVESSTPRASWIIFQIMMAGSHLAMPGDFGASTHSR